MALVYRFSASVRTGGGLQHCMKCSAFSRTRSVAPKIDVAAARRLVTNEITWD